MPEVFQKPAPLKIKCTDSDCDNDLHCFKSARSMAQHEKGKCRACNADLVDWSRLHRRNLKDVKYTLADALGWSKAGFGDYLKALLLQQGNVAPTREKLQDLGQELVTADPNRFVLNVMKSSGFLPGGNLLLDGIRHVDIYHRVVALAAPSLARLLHLSTDDMHVKERVEKRGDGLSDLSRAEGHVVESELATSLPSIADLIIDASAPLDDVVMQCLGAMEGFGVDAIEIENARSRYLGSK